MTRRILARALLAMTCAAGCAGEESPRPSREDCEELRAHVAKVSAEEAGRGLEAAEIAKHAQNLVASAGDEYTTECVEERSKDFVACALAATSTAALSACAKTK